MTKREGALQTNSPLPTGAAHGPPNQSPLTRVMTWRGAFAALLMAAPWSSQEHHVGARSKDGMESIDRWGRQRDQRLEWFLLLLLYLLQMLNAEMLRRAIGANSAWQQDPSLICRFVEIVTLGIHPWAMRVFGLWVALMGLSLLRQRPLPRWCFDVLGSWFCLRMLVECLIINLLIFEPALVAPGVLLGQIVLYLPFFALSWGWLFHRLDWVGRPQPGLRLQLNDGDPNRDLRRFDYFHSTVNALLNKGKTNITGVSRLGRVVVLIFDGMLLALYTVAFARILQLTKAAL